MVVEEEKEVDEEVYLEGGMEAGEDTEAVTREKVEYFILLQKLLLRTMRVS